MTSNAKKMRAELATLIVHGNRLYFAMADDAQGLPDDFKEDLKRDKIKLPNFRYEYDAWYSEALAIVKQLLPDRVNDFTRQYKDEKRKEVNVLTYGISDYLLGVKTTRGLETIVDTSAALGKMQSQNSILGAVEKTFDSSLFDVQEVIQADLFDSELAAAQELATKGFLRGAGAISGVVLEKHLGHACVNHNLKTRKKHPSISDFNQMLKDAKAIDVAKWRFIQHLGDLRNLCDHNKNREPTKSDVLELVEGVEKIIKTVS